jgi:hypothetical protein
MIPSGVRENAAISLDDGAEPDSRIVHGTMVCNGTVQVKPFG